ncbi:uncharacterized protein [Cicer arietinum]|uniref:uncharacterized protein n=1 Tax=Cicer arietinum TaxID=3827 RepID=UPI003CC505C2
MATWDDSNTSLDEDEAQVNMTIMVSVQFDSDSETLDENENEIVLIVTTTVVSEDTSKHLVPQQIVVRIVEKTIRSLVEHLERQLGARGRDGKIIRITRDTETSTSTPMNPPERIRPTASRRRRRMIIEDDDEGHNDQGAPSTVHEEDVVHGWMYMSRRRLHLLMRDSIWRRNMMELRDLVSSHGILEDLMICLSLHDTVIMFQLDYGLARWHSETSSFHMPFGEMTITLDDVANLLGLPIRGEFYSPPDVDRVTTCNLAVHLLGVTTEEIWEETRKTRGAHYRLDWLKEVFRRQCAAERFDCAARAYLLNLVGSTIFADKSHTLVDAKYLPLFRYLDGIDRYAWGTAALVVLYDYLSDACYYDTKQLGGYMTLLQISIIF